MVFEAISFGAVSKVFKNLVPAERKDLCDTFRLSHTVLGSWLHSVNYVSNLCAHHARVWNRICRIKPIRAHEFAEDLTFLDRIYAQLVVVQILLTRSQLINNWGGKLSELLAAHPHIPLPSMGFPVNWKDRAVWK
jgi:abortive infection bacteriophage resistance protein